MTAHNICGDEIMDVELIDEYRMPIDDTIVDLILQFMNCSHFYIEIWSRYQHSHIATTIEVLFSYTHFSHLLSIFNFIFIFYPEHKKLFGEQQWWMDIERTRNATVSITQNSKETHREVGLLHIWNLFDVSNYRKYDPSVKCYCGNLRKA